MKYLSLFSLFTFALLSSSSFAETCYKFEDGEYTPRQMKQCRGHWLGNKKLALEYAVDECNSNSKKQWNKTLSKCLDKEPVKVSCYQILEGEIYNKKLVKCSGDWFESANAAKAALSEKCAEEKLEFDDEELECFKPTKKRKSKKLSKICRKVKSLKSKTENEALLTEIDIVIKTNKCKDQYESILKKVKFDYQRSQCESQGKVWSEVNDGIYRCLVQSESV